MLIGLDPGTRESAVCLIESLDKPFTCFKDKNKLVADEIKRHITAWPPTILVIEGMQSFGMAVGQSTFETAYWIGYFIRTHHGPHRMVFRQDVKLHICGQARAKDGNIRQALIDRFGEPGRKGLPGRTYGIAGDMWSALAIAVTAIENPKLNRSPF